MKKVFRKLNILILLTVFLLPSGIQAAMQSSSYVIYDTLMHAFDGPIISAVSHSVSGQSVTVTWTTNVNSDSFVVFDTDASFATSKEQGTHNKNQTSHLVEVTGLEANTTYNYRVRSERVNGGITTDTTSRTFTTGSDAGEESEPETSSGSGGGLLIIDKTDKAAPEIINIQVVGIDNTSVSVTWETNEDATSFVEYGRTILYGATYGRFGASTSHQVVLENLAPNSQYNFRVLSSDDWGNVAYSENQVFSTSAGEGEEAIVDEEEIVPEEISDEILLNWLRRIFPEVSLNELGDNPLETLRSRADIINLISAPVLSGTPEIETGSTNATIRWLTDIDANSLVALAADEAYNPGAGEPYQQVIGKPSVYTTNHEVQLLNLQPDTLYHIQLRSKPEFGPTARSRDYTFRTTLEELSITSFFYQVIDDQTASFKWVTNKNADSAVTYAPIYNNVIAVDQSKTVRENLETTIHEIEIGDFVGGTKYYVELISQDQEGNIAEETFESFSTAEDDYAPEVSHIKADSTIFVDRGDKIQTIITWLTNEPSTSRVHYQEGVHGGDTELIESTSLNTNYTKEHVMVITKFKPGIVYSFRVESIDSGGNTTQSKVHTFMTAKKKESIIQIIINILENTFGWLKGIV